MAGCVTWRGSAAVTAACCYCNRCDCRYTCCDPHDCRCAETCSPTCPSCTCTGSSPGRSLSCCSCSTSATGLRQRLSATSEIHFVPAISGG